MRSNWAREIGAVGFEAQALGGVCERLRAAKEVTDPCQIGLGSIERMHETLMDIRFH